MISLSLFFGACAHGPRASRVAQPREGGHAVGAQNAGEIYGPEPSFQVVPEQSSYGPEIQEQKSVVLVLGPGLARGYAYTGVIQALSDAKVKIGAIVGTEMGALIGALYSLDASVNRLDWGVQRFREDVFEKELSVLSQFLNKNPAEKYEAALSRVFGEKDLSKTKVPLRVLVQSAGAGVKVADRGSLKGALRAALGNSDGFPPSLWEGLPSGSAAAVRPFDVQDARALGLGPVIAVNVLDPKDSDLFPELKEADLVLQPELRNLSRTDFKKRSEAVFAGKAIVRKHLAEIIKLTGGESR